MAPIDLPLGTIKIEHCCPALLYLGASKEDATFAIILEAGIAAGYLVGECGECDAVFRTRLEPPHRVQP